MHYYYKTPYGIFSILEAPYGGYNLKIDQDVVNWSEKANELANQVYEKTSGFEQWDAQNKLQAPKELEKWSVKI